MGGRLDGALVRGGAHWSGRWRGRAERHGWRRCPLQRRGKQARAAAAAPAADCAHLHHWARALQRGERERQWGGCGGRPVAAVHRVLRGERGGVGRGLCQRGMGTLGSGTSSALVSCGKTLLLWLL